MQSSKSVCHVAWFVLLAACGGGGGGQPTAGSAAPSVTEPTGLWVQGTAGDTLERFADSVNAPPRSQEIDFSPAPVAIDAAGREAFSQTYTLETNIDEHDIVKYNGDILAVAPVVDTCCYLFEPRLAAPPTESPAASIALYRTDAGAGSADHLSDITVENAASLQGLFLDSERLQVLTSSAFFGVWGGDLSVPSYWGGQEVTLETHDIADPQTPALLSTVRIEGALLLARRQNELIHLVTRHTPMIEGLIYYPQSDEDRQANSQILASLTDQDLLPAVTIGDQQIALPGLDTCYRTDPEHPLAVDQPVEVSLTLMLSVSASTGDVEASGCVLDPVSGVAMTDDALVLTWVEQAAGGVRTLVHSVAVNDWRYRGSASVAGALYTGGSADFRINQHQGVLRLVTTEFMDDADDQLDHRLFTLQVNPDRPELEVLAELPGAADAEIGKPNEDLYGVRFFGDRAYLVTFERIDPLYVVDLSDPRAPRLDGVLEVPGFSDLLHPVSDDLLLGVGTGATPHAKVELFDVSEPSAPVSRGTFDYFTDYEGSSSPAQYNRYTFTYLSGDDDDRFSLPISAWRSTDDSFESTERVMLMRVAGKASPTTATLVGEGSIDLTDTTWVSDNTRTVVDGDALFVVSAGQLFAGFWSNPEALQRVSPE